MYGIEARGNSGLGNDMQPAVPVIILVLPVAHVVSDLAKEVAHGGGVGAILGDSTPVIEVTIS